MISLSPLINTDSKVSPKMKNEPGCEEPSSVSFTQKELEKQNDEKSKAEKQQADAHKPYNCFFLANARRKLLTLGRI